MEKVSPRKQKILDVLDEEIEELEVKLRKVQPLIDELNKLKQTRATLLSERLSHSGGVSSRTRLTMEQVIHAMRTDGTPMTPAELADKLGVDQSVVRSHLNRHADTRYEKDVDGTWSLIGEENDE